MAFYFRSWWISRQSYAQQELAKNSLLFHTFLRTCMFDNVRFRNRARHLKVSAFIKRKKHLQKYYKNPKWYAFCNENRCYLEDQIWFHCSHWFLLYCSLWLCKTSMLHLF